MGLRLNLGCSDRFRKGFTNVDICEPADVVCDLESLPWPWDDNSVDEIISDDILEHIHPFTWRDVTADYANLGFPVRTREESKYPIVALMNEVWRVLTPDGTIRIFIPTTDGRGAFQDPTHKTFWNRNTFFYFTDGDPHRERFGKAYGITARFKVVYESEFPFPDSVTKLTIHLQAVK